MHGRVKTRSTAEEQERKRKEKEKKAKLYRAGIEQIFAKHQAGEKDEEMLVVSAQLLSANPDIYTLWNIRREVLMHMKCSKEWTQEQVQDLMESELQLTQQCLKANSKSYGAWHHRSWVLENMQCPNWEKELKLCNAYLDLDERNFHCWDYRRFIVKRSRVPVSEEYAFSTKKIVTNFSNYSSWHYRSLLLPLLFPHPEGKLPIQENKHKEELELVQNAAFTDPNDQSAWFYQRWLLGRAQQPLTILQANVSPSLLCVALTQPVCLTNDTHLVHFYNGDVGIQGSWRSCTTSHYSQVWIFSPEVKIFQGDALPLSITVSLYNGKQQLDTLVLQSQGNLTWTRRSKAQFGAGFSKGISSLLRNELDSCLQLLELEPDSKWTLLTTVLLMQAIDRHAYRKETMQHLNTLLHVDYLRCGYYKDLRSRYEMEYAIEQLEKSNSNGLQLEARMSNLGLTALYHMYHLSTAHTVDLSNNSISRSLSQLRYLQCCQVLKLDGNDITSLQEMPALPLLHTLSLKQNNILHLNDICALQGNDKLVNLDLRENEVEKNSHLTEIACKLFPFLKHLNAQTVC